MGPPPSSLWLQYQLKPIWHRSCIAEKINLVFAFHCIFFSLPWLSISNKSQQLMIAHKPQTSGERVPIRLWCANISVCWWWVATPFQLQHGITVEIDWAGQQLGNVCFSRSQGYLKSIPPTVGTAIETVFKKRDRSSSRGKASWGTSPASYLSDSMMLRS